MELIFDGSIGNKVKVKKERVARQEINKIQQYGLNIFVQLTPNDVINLIAIWF
jgi:hypothetical protein